MRKKTIVILNGSPRRNGTCYSFALTMKKIAEESGCTVELLHIIEYLDGVKSFDSLRNTLHQSDIIGLITPFYVDTIPYCVTWLFERLNTEYKGMLSGKGFFALSQNGFPDITLFEPLIGCCRCIAESTEMKWLGGLGYGGGAMINGALMEDLGKKGAKITYALRLAIDDIINDKQISPEVQDLLTVKIPKALYPLIAAFLNHRARKIAKKYGVKDLVAKVYLE